MPHDNEAVNAQVLKLNKLVDELRELLQSLPRSFQGGPAYAPADEAIEAVRATLAHAIVWSAGLKSAKE